jgi:hypothetical protein
MKVKVTNNEKVSRVTDYLSRVENSDFASEESRVGGIYTHTTVNTGLHPRSLTAQILN